MKKILKATWIAVCCIIIFVYLLSCFTPYITPEKFPLTSLFAVLFPYLFVAAAFCCLTVFFIKKRVALIFLLVILLAGFKNINNTIAWNMQKWNMKQSGNAMRVMTWNCESFINSFPQSFSLALPRIEMLKAIQRYRPDVLCLQEYRNISNDRFFVSTKKELDSIGYTYSFLSNDSVITTFKPATMILGVAFFSRLPLTDTGRINIINKEVNENAVYADVNFNGKQVRVVTAHLRSFNIYRDTTHTGKNIYEVTFSRKHSIEYKLHHTESIHEREITIIRNLIDKSPDPVIYCGDINGTPASYTYNMLRGNMQDAFLEKGSGIGRTFDKLSPTLRIDVCLLDKRLKAVQCTAPQLYLSYHFPIITDVAWK